MPSRRHRTGLVAAPARLFVDSGAWIAIRSVRDQHHAEADRLFRDALARRIPLLTTNLIVAEIHRLYGKPRIRGGGGVDVVINYSGGDSWAECFRTLRLQGRLLTCGATAGYDPKTDIRYIWSFEFNIIGSNGWTIEDQRELLARVAEALEYGACAVSTGFRLGDPSGCSSEREASTELLGAVRTGPLRAFEVCSPATAASAGKE